MFDGFWFAVYSDDVQSSNGAQDQVNDLRSLRPARRSSRVLRWR